MPWSAELAVKAELSHYVIRGHGGLLMLSPEELRAALLKAIVRHAETGAQWKELYAREMKLHAIDHAEIESAIQSTKLPCTTDKAASSPDGAYGAGVRSRVFEVVVRQALAGAPWREICAGPMQVNNITPEEIEAEVFRRRKALSEDAGSKDKVRRPPWSSWLKIFDQGSQ